MDINDMISMAFEQGTGMQRSSVARTARFKQLLAETSGDELVSAYERAEMLYLGERLADAAFMKLPKNVRESATTYDTENAVDACFDLYKNLIVRISHIRQLWPTQNVKLSECVLPQQYSFALRSSVRPNCLGMAQMMVGWARAAGAEYKLVDALRLNDSEFTVGMYTGHLLIEDVLENNQYFPSIRKLHRTTRMRTTAYAKNIEYWARNIAAHHALSIDTGTRGIIVDPYTAAFYSFGKLTLERDTASAPYTQTGYVQKYPFDDDAFSTHISYMGKLLTSFENLALSYGRDSWTELLQLLTRFATDISDLAREVVKASGDYIIEQVPALSSGSQDDLLADFMNIGWGWLMTDDERKTVSNESIPPTERYAAVVGRNRTKRRFMQIVNRIVSHVVNCLYLIAIQNYQGSYSHPLVELNAPEYHLAVMTVNHLAMSNGVDAASLLRHRPFSQSLIRDTLSSVLASNDVRVKQAYDCSQEHLRGLQPEQIMPELRTLVSLERN